MHRAAVSSRVMVMNWARAFLGRLGGMLVAPRETLAAVARGERGGLSDLLWLLLLQVVAVQLPVLVRAGWTMVAVSYSAGISTLLNILAGSMVVQLVGVLAAAVIMGWFTRGLRGGSKNLDLAALCMIPAVFLQLLMSLAVGITSHKPGQVAALAVLSAGGLWFGLLVISAVKLVIAEERSPSDD